MAVDPNSSDEDLVWKRIQREAEEAIARDQLLDRIYRPAVLDHLSFEDALASQFARKLQSREFTHTELEELALQAHANDPTLGQAGRADIIAVFDRDPACHTFIQPLLYFKGFQALQCYRIGHFLWKEKRHEIAYHVQMRVSELFGVDIHPNAVMGQGILIDHAHAIVIGETSVVGDNVSMLHAVTLGGTGKEGGDRHPKVDEGVLLGASAIVLGNITVGHCSRVAAGSVVLDDVPPCKTVAGVPARIVGESGCDQPSDTMNQYFHPSA